MEQGSTKSSHLCLPLRLTEEETKALTHVQGCFEATPGQTSSAAFTTDARSNTHEASETESISLLRSLGVLATARMYAESKNYTNLNNSFGTLDKLNDLQLSFYPGLQLINSIRRLQSDNFTLATAGSKSTFESIGKSLRDTAGDLKTFVPASEGTCRSRSFRNIFGPYFTDPEMKHTLPARTMRRRQTSQTSGWNRWWRGCSLSRNGRFSQVEEGRRLLLPPNRKA